MYADLKGKAALVTGAGKKTGIGYAMAERLAGNGVQVAIADMGARADKAGEVKTGSRDEMQAIAAELAERWKVRTLFVEVDIADPASVQALAETVQEAFGRLDILCNNAGALFGAPNSALGYDEAAWIRTVEVNLFGTFRVSRALIPLMEGRPGAIVNTASRAGKVPPVFNSAYAVSKAGVIMLTKTMARELAGMGIRVNALCPGQIDTDMTRWRFGLEAGLFGTTLEERQQEMVKTVPLGYIGNPGDVADLAVFLASEASRYITGQAINVDGGQCMEL